MKYLIVGAGLFVLICAYELNKKYLREKLAFLKFRIIFNYNLYCAKNKRRVFLLATPTHGNLGDHAIVMAEKQLLNRCGYISKQIIEIRNPDYLRYGSYIQKKITNNDLIIIDGGGNLGILWPQEDDKISDIIARFKNNKIIIFPQTCFYDKTDLSNERLKKNQEIYKKNNLYIFLRDKRSYDFCKENFEGCNLFLCPDIVLLLKASFKFDKDKAKRILLCFRKDLEKNSEDILNKVENFLKKADIEYTHTSTVINKKVTPVNRKKEVFHKLREFSNCSLVITDRLHAMIFSALMGTPCIAFDNVSKKVSGVYKWIEKLDYIKCISDVNKIKEHIEQLKDKKENEFDIDYNHYSKLIETLK